MKPFIDNALKNDTDVPLDPVTEIIKTFAEFYASDFFLAKNNLADNPTEHPSIVLAEKKLAESKTPLNVLLN
jgi:hypothetical protein